ncbi:SatD family protein [Aliarcobacter butzleri]|uniref:SatD family protein n=1 Tax=Aliarcobacter TaxID=2321111 RepID=UPI001C9C0897|nr:MULTISPECIES: SatD family protein [Aliarcobacter]MCT7581217.1 SatD family protein [Aliarcobacter butzleri]
MNKYFILMGDIKNSRKENSERLSSIMMEVISHAEQKFNNDRLSKLEIKVGDDFQVVMKDINSLLNILLYLDIYLKKNNIECRFALGYGTISGNINKDGHSEMIGSGLTNVNEILNKKYKKYSFYIEDEIYKTILLNIIGLLLEDCLSNLTKKQIEFLYHRIVMNKDLNEIEKIMDVKQRAVYDYYKRSKYLLIMNVLEKIELSFMNDSKNLENIYLKDLRLDKGIYFE